MKVSYLGGRKENFAEWKEVYSEQGGKYEMTIRYVPKADRKLEVCVNNEKGFFLIRCRRMKLKNSFDYCSGAFESRV